MMTTQRAVETLDDLDVSDPERAHCVAEDVLLALVHPDVRAAYERLVARAPWWASA